MSNEIRGGIVFHDCYGCGQEFSEDEVSWAMPDGTLTVMKGYPYCDGCLPEYRPPCDCDQSGSGFYLCSYCFAEQVGGE